MRLSGTRTCVVALQAGLAFKGEQERREKVPKCRLAVGMLGRQGEVICRGMAKTKRDPADVGRKKSLGSEKYKEFF